MSRRLRSIVTMGVLVGVTLLLYGSRLGPPPPLSAGEAALFREADRLAATGQDAAESLTPVFFRISEDVWLQPMAVYLTATVLAVTSGGEWAARFAGVLVTALSAVLIYLVAVRLLRREDLGVMTAAIMILSPALFAHARTVSDAPYILPWVLLWLNGVLAFIERPRGWILMLAGFSLGVGVYAQPGAPVTMVLLAALTLPALRAAGHRQVRLVATMGAGFALPLLVMAAWFVIHPETYRDTMGRWAIHQAHIRFPLDGLRAFVNWTTLGARTSLYWGFFDPSWLVFPLPDRTGVLRGGAPFLLPMAMLASLGIVQALKRSPPAHAVLLIGGILVAPIAASTLGEAHNLGQAMSIVPLAALCASVGVGQVLASPNLLWRSAWLLVLGLLPLQFGVFYLTFFAV